MLSYSKSLFLTSAVQQTAWLPPSLRGADGSRAVHPPLSPSASSADRTADSRNGCGDDMDDDGSIASSVASLSDETTAASDPDRCDREATLASEALGSLRSRRQQQRRRRRREEDDQQRSSTRTAPRDTEGSSRSQTEMETDPEHESISSTLGGEDDDDECIGVDEAGTRTDASRSVASRRPSRPWQRSGSEHRPATQPRPCGCDSKQEESNNSVADDDDNDNDDDIAARDTASMIGLSVIDAISLSGQSLLSSGWGSANDDASQSSSDDYDDDQPSYVSEVPESAHISLSFPVQPSISSSEASHESQRVDSTKPVVPAIEKHSTASGLSEVVPDADAITVATSPPTASEVSVSSMASMPCDSPTPTDQCSLSAWADEIQRSITRTGHREQHAVYHAANDCGGTKSPSPPYFSPVRVRTIRYSSGSNCSEDRCDSTLASDYETSEQYEADGYSESDGSLDCADCDEKDRIILHLSRIIVKQDRQIRSLKKQLARRKQGSASSQQQQQQQQQQRASACTVPIRDSGSTMANQQYDRDTRPVSCRLRNASPPIARRRSTTASRNFHQRVSDLSDEQDEVVKERRCSFSGTLRQNESQSLKMPIRYVRHVPVVVNDEPAKYCGPALSRTCDDSSSSGSNNSASARSSGCWIPHGSGVARFESGDVYLGQFDSGQMHGYGTYYRRPGTSRRTDGSEQGRYDIEQTSFAGGSEGYVASTQSSLDRISGRFQHGVCVPAGVPDSTSRLFN